MESGQQHAARRLAASLLGLLLGLPTLAVAESDDLPDSTSAQQAQAAVALLHFNRDLCDRIAGKVIAYWGGLAASPEAELEAVRRFVVNRELSGLAESREAADIVESLLDELRAESDKETSASLERLQHLEIELCDTVAYPKDSREHYRLPE